MLSLDFFSSSSFPSFFTLTEEASASSPDKEVVGTIALDIRRTFAPEPAVATSSIKGAFFITSVFWTFYRGLTAKSKDGDPNNAYSLVYLTNWGLILSSTYLLCSWLCSLLRGHSGILINPSDSDSCHQQLSWLVRLTWFLGALCYPAEVTITALYWVAGTSVDNFIFGRALMSHGIVMLMVMFDVVFVNNLPIRISHIVFTLGLGVVFLIWSGIHAFLGIGDGPIYSILSWKEYPIWYSLLTVVVLLLLIALCFVVSWAFSRYVGPFVGGCGADAVSGEAPFVRRRVLFLQEDNVTEPDLEESVRTDTSRVSSTCDEQGLSDEV